MRDLEGGAALLQDLGCIGICIAVLFVVDLILTKPNFDQTGRWFALHAAANAIIVGFCSNDAWMALTDPIMAGMGEYNLWTVYMVAAIHLYHILFFDNLTSQDWVHHLLFGGVMCLMGILFTVGKGMGLIAFFICGLPGGLDYLMLALVKKGLMHTNTEKRWNSRIMVWIRAPGCVLIANGFYIATRYGPRVLTQLEFVSAIIAGVLVFINGQFYMQRVVGNAYEKDQQIKKTGC